MFFRIRELKKDGNSQRGIASELDIDRKTVKKYLESNTPPKYKMRVRESKEDPFAPYAVEAREYFKRIPDLTASEIYLLIKELGYEGSERTIERRLSSWKADRPKERFFEQEYTPGEQSQFDFKEKVTVPFINGDRIVHLHFSTLPYSDTFFIKAFGFKTYEAYMDGIHSFFEYIGGMTKNIRFDNLSPCVKKVLKGSERLYTESFSKAISYYDFGCLPCAPGKGNEKGDCERDIRTHARRLLKLIKIHGRTFKDFEDLNKWLHDYCVKYLSTSSKARLSEEQSKLKPLPPREEEVLCKVETVLASGYGTIRISKTTYSVPDQLIGASCRVVVGPYEVKIYRCGGKGELISTHERKTEGDSSMPLEHILPSLIKKPKAMVRWAHRKILFPSPVFTKYFEYLKTLDTYGAEREYLKAINLIQYTTLDEIGVGMELVLDSKSLHPFEDLKSVVLSVGGSPSGIDSSAVLSQIPLKPRLSIYDSLIPQFLEVGS
jgi:transposase